MDAAAELSVHHSSRRRRDQSPATRRGAQVGRRRGVMFSDRCKILIPSPVAGSLWLGRPKPRRWLRWFRSASTTVLVSQDDVDFSPHSGPIGRDFFGFLFGATLGCLWFFCF